MGILWKSFLFLNLHKAQPSMLLGSILSSCVVKGLNTHTRAAHVNLSTIREDLVQPQAKNHRASVMHFKNCSVNRND